MGGWFEALLHQEGVLTPTPPVPAPTVFTKTITLTAAEIQNLHVTSILALPAPPAGFTYSIISSFAQLRFNSIAYNITPGDEICLCPFATPPGFNSGWLLCHEQFFLDNTAPGAMLGSAVVGNGMSTVAQAKGPWYVAVSNANAITAGDSDVTFTFDYKLIDLSAM